MKIGVKVITSWPFPKDPRDALEAKIEAWLEENPNFVPKLVAQSEHEGGITHTIYYEEKEPSSLEMAAADSGLE